MVLVNYLPDAAAYLRRRVIDVLGRKDVNSYFAAWLVPNLAEPEPLKANAVSVSKRTGAERTYQDVALLGFAMECGLLDADGVERLRDGLRWMTGRTPHVDGYPADFCTDAISLLGNKLYWPFMIAMSMLLLILYALGGQAQTTAPLTTDVKGYQIGATWEKLKPLFAKNPKIRAAELTEESVRGKAFLIVDGDLFKRIGANIEKTGTGALDVRDEYSGMLFRFEKKQLVEVSGFFNQDLPETKAVTFEELLREATAKYGNPLEIIEDDDMWRFKEDGTRVLFGREVPGKVPSRYSRQALWMMPDGARVLLQEIKDDDPEAVYHLPRSHRIDLTVVCGLRCEAPKL